MNQAILDSILNAEEKQYDSTEERIMDAALQEIAAHGLKKLTLDGVAKRCGMNRTTLHRRFGNKDAVQAAIVEREAIRVANGIRDSVRGLDDLEEIFVRGFVAAIRIARAHPVISYLAKHEPGFLIAIALENDGALLRIGGNFMANAIRAAQSLGKAKHLDADVAGDTAARLFSSFILLPGGSNPLLDNQAAEYYARGTLVPMILG